MNIIELQTALQNLTNVKVSLAEIARALNVSRSNISLRAKNESEVTISEIEKVQDFFNVKLYLRVDNSDVFLASNTLERIKDDKLGDNFKLIGYKLAEIQDNIDYLDKDMAKLMGITEDRYLAVKSGNQQISIEELAKLVTRIDVSLDWLLKEKL